LSILDVCYVCSSDISAVIEQLHDAVTTSDTNLQLNLSST